jgi:hypothetical protein
MAVKRWEDIIPLWHGPSYSGLALNYHPSVIRAPLAGRLIACVDVVDWDGDGGTDLLVSCWDACYEGGLYLFEDTGRGTDGTPCLGPARRIDGITGYVTVVLEGDRFHLLSTSRIRQELHLYVNSGTVGAPRFGEPTVIPIEADWLHQGELLHVARLVDIDNDGRHELLVGTDYWGDYWPANREWNERGYQPYDARGRWLGGPLRGHLYLFRIDGDLTRPKVGRGVPLRADSEVIETYGKLAPAFGRFRDPRSLDVVCGDFLDDLHFIPNDGKGGFGTASLLSTVDGKPIRLGHCIHFPAAVDWDGDGREDLLVGAEDGYISWLRHDGLDRDGRPRFQPPVRLRSAAGNLHGGVLPVPAAYDWNGDGRQDLVVGNSAGEVLFYPNLGGAGAPAFGEEVRCRAGGEEIRVMAGPSGSIQGPSEEKFAYVCPTIVDWDGDGRPDLLFSDITGGHYFYRNSGAGTPPSFEQPVALEFDGRPLRTVWRVRPAVVDWFGNGVLSYICLDEEGRLVCYRRRTNRELTEKRFLAWADGRPVTFTEDFGGGRGRIKLCVCDWTGDGRYDILFGTHSRASVPPGPSGAPRHTTRQAGVFILENLGSNAEPYFSLPRALCHQGEPIRLGMHSCAPEAVTWTGGSLPDLLVGAEDGSLLWFPRSGLTW